MQRDYADAYADLYRSHWWWRARQRILMDEIPELMRDRRDGAILDIGCGDGFFFEKLSQLPGIQEVNSSIVLSDIKHTTVLPM